MDMSLIIIDSEDDSEDDIVEVDEKKSTDYTLSPSKLDEDLVITFSRKAEVLPHARYDCTIHPFTPTDHDVLGPVGSNRLFCDQCFCYVCDKLASMCKVWCVQNICHCNSHKKSVFWSHHRDNLLLGNLRAFNLQVSDLDNHLRHADSLLNIFKSRLNEEYCIYLMHSQRRLMPQFHDYSPVYECLSSFLDEADRQEDRAAAIMRLGAAHDFLLHYHVPGFGVEKPHNSRLEINKPEACAYKAKSILLQRVIDSVQRQMVMTNFTSEFIYKLAAFYQRLSFTPLMRNLKNSLCVRPWDDLLLVSVLRGQNVTGVRKDKGKKDMLVEPTAIVLLRSELLQQQHRYRELARYIRVVQTNRTPRVDDLRDLIPLFKAMAGEFHSAITAFFPVLHGPASRLRPHLFCLYLRIFSTATGPMVTTGLPTEPVPAEAEWQPIEGATLSRPELVMLFVRLLKACPAVYDDCQCWANLLELVNTPSDPQVPLVEPSPTFIQDVRTFSRQVLDYKSSCRLPWVLTSGNEFKDQALLLFVTEALAQRVLQSPLKPAFPFIGAFKDNMWCFRYLCDSLTSSPDTYHYFLQGVQLELEKAGGSPEIIQNILQTSFRFTRTGSPEIIQNILQTSFRFTRTERHISIHTELECLEMLVDLNGPGRKPCPLCPQEKFKACYSHTLRRHLQNLHWKIHVEFEGQRMCICRLPCRHLKPSLSGDQASDRHVAHFHCVVCSVTIARKTDMISHLKHHVNKGETEASYTASSDPSPFEEPTVSDTGGQLRQRPLQLPETSVQRRLRRPSSPSTAEGATSAKITKNKD